MMMTGMMAALVATAPAQAAAPAPPAPIPPAAVTPATPSAPPIVFPVPPIPPTDPARLAAARPVIDRVWPKGTYGRLMRVMMGPFMQSSIARTLNMKPSELLAGLPIPGAQPGNAKSDETIGQMAAASDPYFQQRMTLTLNAVGDAMATLMDEQEPEVRDALAHAYARRFTRAQLGELDRFLSTPTGAAYAADSTMLMLTPDMAAAMQSFTPRLIKAMPDIIAKVTAATKDLPPPGKAKGAPPPVIPPVKTP